MLHTVGTFEGAFKWIKSKKKCWTQETKRLLTVSVPLDLWLVAVQGRVDDDCTSQTHGLTLSSKWYAKLINNVSLEGDAILRHWAVYRQNMNRQSQSFYWRHCRCSLQSHRSKFCKFRWVRRQQIKSSGKTTHWTGKNGDIEESHSILISTEKPRKETWTVCYIKTLQPDRGGESDVSHEWRWTTEQTQTRPKEWH